MDAPPTPPSPHALYAEPPGRGGGLLGAVARTLVGLLPGGALLVLLVALARWGQHLSSTPMESGTDPFRVSLQLGATMLLGLLAMGPPVTLVRRWAVGRSRRGDSSLRRTVFANARSVLAAVRGSLEERLGSDARILGAWVSAAPLRHPIHTFTLLSEALVVGMLGIVLAAALAALDGWPGDLVGQLTPIVVALLALLTPGHGVMADLVTVPLPLLLGVGILPTITGRWPWVAPGPLELVLLALVAALVVRCALGWRRELQSRILVQTTRGWSLARVSWANRLRHLDACDTARVPGARVDEDGIHLVIPLAGGGAAPFVLEHADELTDLAARAPGAWREALARPEVGLVPLIPRARFAVFLGACLVATSYFMLGTECALGLLPPIQEWAEGRPDAMVMAARRIRDRYPWCAMSQALLAMAEVDQGHPERALAPLETARWISRGGGQAGKLVRDMLDDPDSRAYLEAARTMDRELLALPPPEGVPGVAFRLHRRALLLEALFLEHQPDLPSFPAAGLVSLEREALREAGGSYPEAQGHLVELLGRVRLPLDWSVPALIPVGERPEWESSALARLDEAASRAQPQARRQLRARILFRAGRPAEAIPLLEGTRDPSSRLLLASALRSQPGRVGEALELVAGVRGEPEGAGLDADLLEAMLLAQGGAFGAARALLDAATSPPSRARRAGHLRLLVDALDPATRDARVAERPEAAALEPPGRAVVGRDTLAPWYLDADLVVLEALGGRGGWSAVRVGPVDSQEGALERVAGLAWYPFRDLAARLVAARTRTPRTKG